jgi:hypothetical protein
LSAEDKINEFLRKMHTRDAADEWIINQLI